jgi:3-hydroxyisobutyrate dehydrogenase-like beta-hydroxyacid dehydrogenase
MTLALSRKDLSLINEYAQSMGIRAEVVGAALAEVSRACESGLADRDMSALAGFLSNGAAT